MFGGAGRALSSPHYRRYACGHIANVFGWWGYRLGIGWLVWELTKSPGWLGIFVFAGMIPVTIAAPIAGALADRHGHRRVAMIAATLSGTVMLATLLITAAGEMTVPLLLALSILQGIAFGTEFPARQALIPQLVKRENVPAALAFNSTTFQVGTFLGPVLAGWLIHRWGSWAALALYAFSNYWMVLMLAILRYRPPPAESKPPRGFFSEIGDGFRHIGDVPALRILFAITVINGILLRPYLELMPGFAADVFGGGPETLGTLTAASGFGALAMGTFLVFRGRNSGLVRLMIAGVISGSAGLAAFSATDDLRLGVGLLALSAFLMLACHIGAYSLIQNVVEPAMRGRVISVNIAIVIGGPAIGAMLIGWWAEVVGLQWAVASASVLAILGIVTLMPAIRRHAGDMEKE